MNGVRASLAALLIFVGFVSTAQVNLKGPATATPRFGEKSCQYLRYFDQKGAREAGQKSEKDAAAYIISELASMGYAPERQAFSELVQKKRAIVHISSQNVVCTKTGRSEREILVTAHYDSVVDGNGTDDNASGVALLLESCRAVRDLSLPYTVKFVFFGAEEVGDIGSNYYLSRMDGASRARTLVVLNYDSLAAGDRLYAHGSPGSRGVFRDWFLRKAEALGVPLHRQSGRNSRYPDGTTGDWGDHAPFDRAGIPYATFEATNWDLGDLDGYTQTDERLGRNGRIWHTKYDNLSYIDSAFPGRATEHLSECARLLYEFLTEYNQAGALPPDG